MSRHYQFESYLSITGANADERYVHKPSETGAVALALLGALGGGTSANVSGKLAEGVKKAAAALKEAGFNAVSYVSENTGHEFLTWRRSLYELAPLLFK